MTQRQDWARRKKKKKKKRLTLGLIHQPEINIPLLQNWTSQRAFPPLFKPSQDYFFFMRSVNPLLNWGSVSTSAVTCSGKPLREAQRSLFTFPGVGWDPNTEAPWEITALWPCTMLHWHGPKGSILPLVLSLLLTTCAGQDSLEDLELDDESNSVSTESPVSSAAVPMRCAPVFMFSCGFVADKQAILYNT